MFQAVLLHVLCVALCFLESSREASEGCRPRDWRHRKYFIIDIYYIIAILKYEHHPKSCFNFTPMSYDSTN